MVTVPSFDRMKEHDGLTAWFADYDFDRIGALDRHTASVTPRFGNWSPGVTARLEYDTSAVTQEVMPSLGWNPRSGMQYTVSWHGVNQSLRDSAGPGGQEQSRLSVFQGDVHLSTIRNLDVQATAGYLQSGTGIAAQNQNQFFTSVVAGYSLPAGIQSHLNFDQKYEQAVLTREVFVPVDTGHGHYSFNPQTRQYYPDTLGTFNRQVVSTGTSAAARTTTLDFTGSVTHWQWLDLELNSGLDRQVTDSMALVDNWNAGARCQLFPNEKSFSFTLADNVNSTAGQSAELTSANEFTHQPSVEVRLAGNENISGTGLLEFPLTRQTEPGGALNSRDMGIDGTLEPRVGFGLDLDLKAGYGVRTIDMPAQEPAPFHLRTLTLGASRRFELFHGAVLNAELDAERRQSDIRLLPYEVTITDPLGWSEQATVNLDRSLGSSLVLSASYSFTKRPDESAENSLSASLKAYF